VTDWEKRVIAAALVVAKRMKDLVDVVESGLTDA